MLSDKGWSVLSLTTGCPAATFRGVVTCGRPLLIPYLFSGVILL